MTLAIEIGEPMSLAELTIPSETPPENHISLSLPADLRIEDWQTMGRRLCLMEQRCQWWLGDWWAFGEIRYGSRAKLVADGIFGKAYQTLFNCANVAKKFELNRRRLDLTFTHHAEVACLSEAAAEAVLDQARDNGWSVKETRMEVLRRRLGIEPTGPVAYMPPCEPYSTAKTAIRTTRVVLAAFCDWFGLGEEYGRVLMVLYQGGGAPMTWQDISRGVSTHAPMNRGALHEAISNLREIMDTEAIDRSDDGYMLSEVGFAECRAAFREMGQRLLSLSAEPANDL